MTKRRIIKWLAGVTGLLLITILALALVVPRIFDSEAAKEKIRLYLSEQTAWLFTIEKIDFLWLPRPAVVIRGATVAMPGHAEGTIQSIKVYPTLLALLTGRLAFSRIIVERPMVTTRLPESSDEPLKLEEIERKIRALLAGLPTAGRQMDVHIAGGSAEITIGKRLPVGIKDLDAQLVALGDELEVKITARSNLTDKIHVEGKLTGDNRTTTGHVAIEQLRLREALAALLPQPLGYIEDGAVNLDLSLTAVGVRKINVQVDASLPSLVLARNGEKTVIEAQRLKGAVTYENGSLRAHLEQLELVSPRLTASGEISLDQPSSALRMRFDGRHLDIGAVREAAQKVAGDSATVQDIFRYLRGGTLAQISFQASGRSLVDMLDAKNISITGRLRDGKLFVPGPDIELTKVSGIVEICGGILEAKELAASLGTTKGWDGRLRVGLEGGSAPFHIDMRLAGPATEVRSALLRLVKDAAIHREISKIHKVAGNLAGRLILGERLDAIAPTVTVSKVAVSALYEPLPHPITIKEGAIHYREGKFSMSGLNGTVGRSSFSGLTGSVHNDEQRNLAITSGSLSLDLEQARALLLSVEPYQKDFAGLQSAQGKLDLSSLSVNGPLYSPERWNFNGAGKVENLKVVHTSLAGPVTVARGKFAATPARLTFSEAQAEMLDASLTVGGHLEKSKKALLSLELTGTGMIGEQMYRWLSRTIDLPKEITLRPPLKVHDGRILWSEAGTLALSGDFTVGNGPRLSLNATHGPDTLTVKELILQDGRQRADIALKIDRDEIDLSFKGAVDQQMLDNLFESSPLQGSLLQGDFAVSVPLKQPERFSARGSLAGKDLLVRLKEQPVLLETLLLEAGENKLTIRSADLRWRKSRFSMSGTLAAEKDALRADMDVAADRVVWEEIRDWVGQKSAGGANDGAGKLALPPVVGNLRFKTDSFAFDRFNSSPLKLSAMVSASEARAEVEQAVVCGIDVAGRLDFTNEAMGLDLRLAATDGNLEVTSRCLTNEQTVASGKYSLKAQLAGRGRQDRIAKSLNGTFEFVARDGQIMRLPQVDAAFDYLNRTGDFNVAFPDLDKAAWSYDLVSGRGTIDGENIVNDEVVIRAAPYTLSGQGKVDLGRKQVDGKGLVSVQLPASQVIRRIPLIGPIVSGSLVGIPVQISGSLESPNVTYLSPTALGAELLNMPLRILGIPLEAIQFFTPGVEGSEKK